MVTTIEVAPSPFLAPFVRCYSYREFDTRGADFTKPWHAVHEITMPFFFNALPVKLVNLQTGEIVKRGTRCGVIGLTTQYNGEMTFNGRYAFFQISFRPNGFHKIFGLPPTEIPNQIIYGDDIFDSRFKILFEQLSAAVGLNEMGALANTYLLSFIKKQKTVVSRDAITWSSNYIVRNGGLVNIEKLANNANMSLRSFERNFTREVGVTPKLYGCITRFSHALALKLKTPHKDWTSIAFKAGYFDQMQLIKDFKRFSGSTPLDFIKQTPLTEEIYTSRVEE